MDSQAKWILFFSFMGILMGWCLNEMWEEYQYKRSYNGIYAANITYSDVLGATKTLDNKGDWVCINVRGMTFEKMVEVCQHEAGHEIFAEIIENHPEKIVEVMEVVEDGL